MAKLLWDETGKRIYETGVDHCVLYTEDQSGALYKKATPWSGITSVSENPSGADAEALFADNMKYLNLMAAEDFGATIEAYTYPDEFAICDGTAEIETGIFIGQQTRKTFGLAYRTLLGNDVKNTEYGYKLHLIYGATASPSEKSYNTVNDSPEAITFSWEITTTAVTVTGHKPTACLTIDSTKVAAAALKKIEDALFGTETNEAYLPTPDEIVALIKA